MFNCITKYFKSNKKKDIFNDTKDNSNKYFNILNISPNTYLIDLIYELSVNNFNINTNNSSFEDKIFNLTSNYFTNNYSYNKYFRFTNVILELEFIDINLYNDLIEFINNLKYFNTIIRYKNNSYYIIISGSILDFYFLYNNTNKDNIYTKYTIDKLQYVFEKYFIKDIFGNKVINLDDCEYLPNAKIIYKSSQVTQIKSIYEKKYNDNDNYDEVADYKDPNIIYNDSKSIGILYNISNISYNKKYNINKYEEYSIDRLWFIVKDNNILNELSYYTDKIIKVDNNYIISITYLELLKAYKDLYSINNELIDIINQICNLVNIDTNINNTNYINNRNLLIHNNTSNEDNVDEIVNEEVEEIKNEPQDLSIKTVEDAAKYLEKSEEYNKLK